MQWTFDHHKRYSAEHMQKADKYRLAKELEQNPTPMRRGILGKRRATRHHL